MKDCKKKTRTDPAEQYESGLILARPRHDVKVKQILSYSTSSYLNV